MSLTPHQLAQAKNALITAHATWTTTALALAQAQAELKRNEAEMLDKGVTGDNKEQREARVRLALVDEHDTLIRCEEAHTNAKHELECARLEWDALRYTLRLLEATPRVTEGVA